MLMVGGMDDAWFAMVRDDYDFVSVELESQAFWKDCITGGDYSCSKGDKMYVLGMFPYPSGQLHMGHLRNYAITDAIARFCRANGHNVLHPIGWDAFGLPAENAARELRVSPADWTKSNIEAMAKELQAIGISYDWERALATCDPAYYKHEQEFFIRLFEDGIAYKKLSVVNWDPVDNTVLANEQVINGCGWRSGAPVEKRELSQWFLRISDYSEDLLSALDSMSDWPEAVKSMQREWIGKSSGCEIDFVTDWEGRVVRIFTTRPETIFGASFCAVAIGHNIAKELAEHNREVSDFIERSKLLKHGEKDMVATGLSVANPFVPEQKLPLYVANFVLADYGTGAIFGCPAHDARDNEAAAAFDLPIRQVVQTESRFGYLDSDLMINSGMLDGMTACEAREAVMSAVCDRGIGRRAGYYRLNDWGVSRQRYWGCPIPIIYCNKCGTLPAVDLPVTLPADADFNTKGNPLDSHPTWKHVKCHKCGGDAVRETDTFDTFIESSWYFIGFCSESMAMDGANKCLPVDYYVGGIEHAILHLLYARYFTRLLNKYGYVDIIEPFKRLITQGMVCHKTYKSASGQWITPEEAKRLPQDDVVVGPSVKMSKSKKNTVSPSAVLKSHGADAARLFILSDSPIEKQLEWSEQGLDGALRFLRKMWSFVLSVDDCKVDAKAANHSIKRRTHIAVKRITECMRQLHYNVCIARIREFFNFLSSIKTVSSAEELAELRYATEVLLRVSEPLVPHITQALWRRVLRSNDAVLMTVPWPDFDPNLAVEDDVSVAVQVAGVTRGLVVVPADAPEDVVRGAALKDAKVTSRLADKHIKKVVFVQNRVINFIV